MQNNIEFPVTSEYGIEELKLVQRLLLSHAVLIRNLLEQEDIKFCLSFGSVLGAVRHKGFIPWDDDLDFFIADEDYENAMKTLESRLPEYLIIHSRKNDPHYYHNWNRVKDLRTEVESAGIWHEHNDRLKFKCLSIDLHRLSLVSEKNIANYIREEAEAFWRKKLDSSLISEHEFQAGMKGIEGYVQNKVVSLNIPEPGAKDFRFCVILTNTLLADSVFFPCKYVTFENERFPVPANSDAYLKATYGNYKKLPIFKERLSRLKNFKLIN